MPTKKTTYTPAQRAAYGRKMAAARSKGTVSGKGFYKGFGRDLGRGIGGAFSAVTGLPGGAQIGGWLGQQGANITGWGAYHVSKNSILAPQNVRIRNEGKYGDEIVVRHREYIGDIDSSTTFTKAYELDLNPGLAAFPWLSGVANNFQVWQPNGIIFEYVPMSGTAVTGTNAQLGSVIMATQHDSLEKEFNDKTEMLNHNFAVSVCPCDKAILPIECDPRYLQAQRLYVRDSEPPSTADKRLSDLGRVTIATSDCQDSGSLLGSLYVTYEVKLMLPKLTHATGALVKSSHYDILTATSSNPFGASTTKFHDSIGIVFDNSTQITIPKNSPGKYLFTQTWLGSATANLNAPDLSHTNVTALNMWTSGTTSYFRTQMSGGEQADRVQVMFAFEVTDSSKVATITYSVLPSVLPGSITNSTLLITQIDDDVL